MQLKLINMDLGKELYDDFSDAVDNVVCKEVRVEVNKIIHVLVRYKIKDMWTTVYSKIPNTHKIDV